MNKEAILRGFYKRAADVFPSKTEVQEKFWKGMTQTDTNNSKLLETFDRQPADPANFFQKTKYNVTNHPFLKDFPGGVVGSAHGGAGFGEIQKFSPDSSGFRNYRIANPDDPSLPWLADLPINEQQLANYTNPKAHNVFLTSCNLEGAMSANTLSKAYPDATNIVHVPKNRYGILGDRYELPNYFHATNSPVHQKEMEIMKPNSTKLNSSIMQNWEHNDNTMAGMGVPSEKQFINGVLSDPKLPVGRWAMGDQTAPPNVYRKVNNEWLSHGPYIAGKTNYTPQPEMNKYQGHDDYLKDKTNYLSQAYQRLRATSELNNRDRSVSVFPPWNRTVSNSPDELATDAAINNNKERWRTNLHNILFRN